MTREHKLALLIGFSLVLVVGIVVSDHFSGARTSQLAEVLGAPDTAERDTVDQLAVNYQPLKHALPLDGPQAPLPETTFVDRVTRFTNGVQDQLQGLGEQLGSAPVAAQPEIPAGLEAGHNSGPATPTADTRVVEQEKKLSLPPELKPFVHPIHRVREGDTLTKIAREHYGDARLVPALQKFNAGRVGPDGRLLVGASLLIPPPEVLLGKAPVSTPPKQQVAAAPTRSDLKSPPAKPTATPQPKTYTVQKGDTLATISKKTLGDAKRWREILDLNASVIDDEDTLHVGAKLKIPAK